jgi:hypothetical protein
MFLILVVVALSCANRSRERYSDSYRDRYNPSIVSDVNWSDLEPNLVVWYKMDCNEPNTTVLDSSGNGYHGTSIRNTNLMSVDGEVGGAFQFDNDWFDTVQSFESVFKDSFSISYWLLVNESYVINGIVFIQATALNQVELSVHKINEYSLVYAYYKAHTFDPIVLETEVNIPIKWNMVTMTVRNIDGVHAVMKVYFNGIKIAEQTKNVYMPEFVIVDKTFRVGDSLDGFDGGSTGMMDEFMLFNKALSQTEITVLYEKEY